MLEVGTRVIIVGDLCRGSVGVIVDILKQDPYWDYRVDLTNSTNKFGRCIFVDKEVVAIPEGATEDQIKAVKSLCLGKKHGT